MYPLRPGVLGLVCIILIGCGESPVLTIPPGKKVSGKIRLADGKPLDGGRVMLLPTAQGAFIAFGDVGPDGRFALVNQKEQPSTVPGTYKVYVTLADPKTAGQKSRVPPKYLNIDAAASDVEVTIERDTDDLTITLKK